MSNLQRCKIHNLPLQEDNSIAPPALWCPVCESLKSKADDQSLAEAEAENSFFRPQVDEDEEPREW